MRGVRLISAILLAAICVGCLAAVLLLPADSYAVQFRESARAGISWRFPLGSDGLGRDRLMRLLYAAALSIVLAPAAALLSVALAGGIGGAAGYFGGRVDRCVVFAIDLVLSLPWLFLLITARALLPLNVSPAASVLMTFGILGMLGWAPAARVIRAGVRDLRGSGLVLQSRASGLLPSRILLIHVLPNLRPILAAQFWTSVPVFILSEANLGVLGLGVGEPIPSWGNMLRQLQSEPHWSAGVIAPLVILAGLLSVFQIVFRTKEVSA